MPRLPDGLNLPEITPFNEAWFTSGSVAVQRCEACGCRQHPPGEVCHRCGGESFGHDVLSPVGRVYSHTVIHHAASPALAESVPYTVVIVALDEDPTIRVVGNLEGPGPPATIGLPVEAYWEEHQVPEGVIRLPQWRPRNTRGI
jgi:uncharacterized OB-fold protein